VSSPQFVNSAWKVVFPVDDELFDEYPWLCSKVLPAKKVLAAHQPVFEARSPISPYHLKYLIKIAAFFERYEELLQGPTFTRQEINAAIVALPHAALQRA